MIHFNKINRDNRQHLKKSLKANSDIACETLTLPTVPTTHTWNHFLELSTDSHLKILLWPPEQSSHVHWFNGMIPGLWVLRKNPGQMGQNLVRKHSSYFSCR